MTLTYEQYIALGFSVLFASFFLAFKEGLTKRLSAIFSVAFLLRVASGFLNTDYIYINLFFNFYSYILLTIAFFYSIRVDKAFRQIKKKAYLDPLTQVYNRSFLEEVLKGMIANMENLGINYCVVFIDMYKFKSINDTYGHQTGDKVLAELGKRLKSSVREKDYVVRYGGDEFLVVLTDVGEDKVLYIVERLKKNLTFEMDGIEVKANLGYAIYPTDGRGINQLISIASKRMYEDKRLTNLNEGVGP